MDASFHFNLGLRAPQNQLFNIRVLDGLQARLIVNLTYCRLGKLEGPFQFSDEDSVDALSRLLLDLPLHPEHDSSAVIVSNEAGPGTTRLSKDKSCIRVFVQSNPINQSVSFSAVFVSFRPVLNTSMTPTSDATSHLNTAKIRYFPTLGNMFVEYTSNTDNGVFADPGGLINMSDIFPPVYAGCPSEDLLILAEGAHSLNTAFF